MLPLQCHTNRKKWKCELIEDWSQQIDRLRDRGKYHFRTEKHEEAYCREWLKLEIDGKMTLRKGYGTDGCSVVPDFPETLPGCVLHDALRQAAILDKDRCPWTYSECDTIFREVMRAHGANFLLRWTYWLGVAGPTGWAYSLYKKWFDPPQDKVC